MKILIKISVISSSILLILTIFIPTSVLSSDVLNDSIWKFYFYFLIFTMSVVVGVSSYVLKHANNIDKLEDTIEKYQKKEKGLEILIKNYNDLIQKQGEK